MPFLAPIFAGIAAAATAVGSFVTGLGFIGQALLSIGLNLAISALTPKPKASPGGVELELQLGEEVARKLQCGLIGSAGHLIYANAYGSANGTLQQFYQLSDFPITSLDKIWIDGELATWGAVDANKGAVLTNTDYAGRIWYRVRDGSDVTADAELVAQANPSSRWTSAHIGVGVAGVILAMQYDREKLTNPPQFFFEFKGAALYDWRLDSTAGGSGTHRWADQTTWAYSANPVVQAYNYQRGISYNGDIFCGMEMTSSDLPVDRWTTAANICDELVSGRTRYVCSIGLDCTAEHGDNIDAIMQSCGGLIVSAVDGSWPIVGTSQSTVGTLTDGDLIVGQAVRVQRKRAMNELVNSVSGTYPNPDNQWSPAGYETATDAATVTADRRTRDVQMQFETVPDGIQAAQLAAIYFSENRFEGTATIVVRPRWQVLEPGDWISWASARYGTRTWLVTDMQVASIDDDGPRNVTLSLQERSGDIYDAVSVVLPDAPVANSAPSYQSELLDFAVLAISVVGGDARARPAIRVSWTEPADPTVSGVTLQWRVKTQPDDVFDRSINVGQTLAIIADGVMSATIYEVRHRLNTDPARVSSWSAYVEVTTGDIGINLADMAQDVIDRFADIDTDISTNVAAIAQEVTDRADAVTAEAVSRVELAATYAENIRATRDDLLALADEIVDLGANAELERQTLRTEITSTFDTATASYEQLILVATGYDAGAVEQTTLSARIFDEVADREAAIIATNAAFATADTANALQTTTLESQVRGSYTGSDYTLAGGMFSQVNATQTSQYESLTTSIASLSAGVDEQFDFATIWNFDTTIESWTGNGTPTWVSSGGWLKQADHATDPYVISPAALAIDLDTYGQVRLRIRRTGTPTWEGYIWWKLTGDSTWDTARRVTAAEPTYASEIAIIAENLGATGELAQIRIDLSSDQDASNYFEIDWIATGRPSPGASVASLDTINQTLTTSINTEASTREALSTKITGAADPSSLTLSTLSAGLIYDAKTSWLAADSVIVASVTALDGVVTHPTTGLSATVTLVDALTGRVDATETDIATNVSDISSLTTTVDGKATIAALDALEGTINVGNLEGLSVNASSIRSLESAVLADAMETVELGADARLTDRATNAAVAGVFETTFTRLDATDVSLTSVAGRTTVIEAAIPDLADAAYVETIETRVTSSEGSITAVADRTTTLEATVDGAAGVVATADAVTTLTARVDLKAQVFAQASAPSVTGLAEGSLWIDIDDDNKQYVLETGAWTDRSTAGMTVYAQDGEPITTVVGALWYDTNDNNIVYRWSGSTWVDLTDTVYAQQVTDLEASYGDISAAGKLSFETSAGPTGVAARFAAKLRASVGGDENTVAGFYVDLRDDGGTLKSEFVVLSDRFIVVDPTATTTTASPLVFSGGVLKLENIVVGTVTFDQLSSTNGKLVMKGSGTDASIEVFS